MHRPVRDKPWCHDSKFWTDTLAVTLQIASLCILTYCVKRLESWLSVPCCRVRLESSRMILGALAIIPPTQLGPRSIIIVRITLKLRRKMQGCIVSYSVEFGSHLRRWSIVVNFSAAFLLKLRFFCRKIIFTYEYFDSTTPLCHFHAVKPAQEMLRMI